ncbi:outer membrane protein P2-like protein [Haemophilus parahaemolyticus]|uniref:Outer membrane protein P2 n=1 Tax=Haemophilus parahaemolyticus TaxID=735 RepID=A0A377I0P7_HAEPH|nr:outer membrane protein P2-like protein [Haemophilus parahaemolyticus]
MKKTLVALTVAAFAASSAHAVTVLDANGTKVDFDGSLRLALGKTKETTTDLKSNKVEKTSESALKNDGSRFRVKVKHTLAQDFYGLAGLELRFLPGTSRDEFGNVYAHRAFAGLGSKQYGELTFGRRTTIADDLIQTNDYDFGLVSNGGYIPTSGTGVVRYDYKGVEGLTLSANYNFGQNETEKQRPVKPAALKNAYAAGALFAQDNFDVRFAYGHSNYETGSVKTLRRDGYLASASYQLGDLTLISDFGYAHEKNEATATKTNKFYVAPGFEYQVVPASKVYGNYFYQRSETKKDDVNTSKAKKTWFLTGC